MLDYRYKVFFAVTETLSFTRAAAVMQLSQPAVTQHIKALETRYGLALFKRMSSGVGLTPAGQKLLLAVKQVMEWERQTEEEFRGTQNYVLRSLRIGASSTIAQYFLPIGLSRFQHQHPEVRLELRVGSTREISEALREGQLDLGLVEGPNDPRDLHAEFFLEDELVCVVAPRHGFARGHAVDFEELNALGFVLRETGSDMRQAIELALKERGIAPKNVRVRLETDRSETIKGLVAEGSGAAFLSRWAVSEEVASGKLQIVAVEGVRIAWWFSFLHTHGPRPSGVVADFMSAVASAGARGAQEETGS
jgi:DNA-binding transcriptional LysR family regulator